MTVALQASAAAGFGAGLELLPVALAGVRARLFDACDNLDSSDWLRGSRCELWSVHELVRHMRDVARIHVAGLGGGPTPFSSGDPFDARDTPRRWLEETESQSAAETVAELRRFCGAEAPDLETRLAASPDDVVAGPYGYVHWTVLSAHVVWDTWLHVRDITEVVGGAEQSTPAEDAVVALYSLLIASMPAVAVNHPFEVDVALSGADGQTYVASVSPGAVSLRTASPAADVALEGDLAAVADSLTGRGDELESVLHGDARAREPLSWLRSRMLPDG